VPFDLRAIGVITLAALGHALLPGRRRGWWLLIGSALALYWLQPPLAPRYADFVLPTATLALVVLCWRLTARAGMTRDDWLALAVLAALVLALSGMRYVDAAYRLTPSRPPEPLWVGTALACLAAMAFFTQNREAGKGAALLGGTLLVVALLALKTPLLASTAAAWWRAGTGQDVTLAGPLDLSWLGFSYVAFRLLHTLLERRSGLLPEMTLREYVTYALFAPALVAGPIDRAERFTPELRTVADLRGLDAARWAEGLGRVARGLLLKFVLADGLAHGAALTATSAAQAASAPWLWVLLYGYSLRLFFDFAGYSDIAIGLGLLFGVRLPENFVRPYRQSNLTAFWQSWHITLSHWARFYVFTPLSRWLLTRRWRPPSALIVLAAQLATMLVIGLWHGVTPNYALWGLWHAAGLFAHKLWADRTRKRQRALKGQPWRRRAWTALSWLLTFHYVTLGWVWFAVPDTGLAGATLGRLFGVGW
jgi:alginate O-acetyltransferase complex protein AlgI